MGQSKVTPDAEDGEFLQVLWEDGERVFGRTSRAGLDGDRRTVLVVTPASEAPTTASLDHLAHEYSLKEHLDASWAVRPLELVRQRGRTMLVLDDPGAEPLHRLLGSPMELPQFLRLAEALAAALRGLHESGLIHKDINPANVLVRDATGEVWLTGFGVTSRQPRERQAPAEPEFIVGTLAYMAPEQTGRMNRSIDSRSDLYSLGVTFYQMLTGALPFAASDPMELVHCHIARAPAPPRERLGTIPTPISQLVMKLLAKTAEERYQTAAGVEHDLRRCRADYELRGRIDEFPLAGHDVPDRLMIPEKLYGRAHEVAALLDSFSRVAATGMAELVLVSGYSGIGKSSVVNELQKVLVPPRGLFAAGKFDRNIQDIPYATVAQAFRSLVRQILSKNDAELRTWRDALGEALDENGQLIVALVPELELVIGQQPPVADLSPRDAQRRFQTVLRRFIGVFARPEHPLALFVDDLQWLDPATLDLLEDLLTHSEIRHLLLIGAYRDNEVDSAHPLLRKLDTIRRAGAAVQDIVLTPLTYDDLGQLITDSLHRDQKSTRALALLVQERTGGNPFFANQFLHALADEALLVFDHRDARWSWDLERIHAKRYTGNVVDLMVGKLNRLPTETQAALRQLACVGAATTFAVLGTVCETSLDELHDSLWEAVRTGLVLRLEDSYAFQHDRIQEAAYSLIPEEARAEVHVRIGRLLLARTPPTEREKIIFEIVNQFNRSLALITSPEEREQVAQLNLVAGKRAKHTAAYSSALMHFCRGRALLGADCWTRLYPLAFELEFHRAECEFLTGELASAEERLSALAYCAANPLDLCAVTCLRLDFYLALGRFDRAIDVGIEYLQQVGLRCGRNPTEEEARQEYEQIWQRLGVRRIEDLINLPQMRDLGRRATMEVVIKLVAPATVLNPRLHHLLIAYLVNFSLEYGNSDVSCFAYVSLGWILAADFGDYPAALRFGQLGVDLLDNYEVCVSRAAVYVAFAFFIRPWVRHIRSARPFLLRASDEANKIGDLAYIGYCDFLTIESFIATGEPLDEVECKATDNLNFARKNGYDFIIGQGLSQLYLTRTLRGLPLDFRSLDDREFDEHDFEQFLESDPNLAMSACWYWIRKLQVHVFVEDYEPALVAATKAQALLWTCPAFFQEADYHFYAALARAGSCRASGEAQADQETTHLESLGAHHRRLEIWAKHCPENFENRAALVGAEIARLEGRDLDAERLYEEAIRSASANGFVHNEALACQAAARFYAKRGLGFVAEMLLAKACDGYRRWGADGVLRHLEAHPRQLVMVGTRSDARATVSSGQQLDLAAVVKSSQALSSEMLLPRLVERLMTIALQNAGADRGLLVLAQAPNSYRIEAEARTDGDVIVLHDVSTGPAVPESIVRYVMRTQESLILDEAADQSPFSGDPYFAARRARSVLCLPLVRQGELSGLLYLENSLASHVFTADRARLLELLASQAAISLQNAALYADLELQVGLLQQLPVSAWTIQPDGTPDFVNQVWLDFSGQTPEFIRSDPEAWMTAVHPEDREMAARCFWEGVRSGQGFAFETRSLRAKDRTYRRHLQQAVVLRDAEGKVLKFVGTTTDIDDLKQAEERLRQAQSDLAHVARVATLNAMTASIAHEVSQPLSGILTNANTGLRMLTSEPPNVAGAVETARRTIRDANRAAGVLKRLREMFSKKAPITELVDLNETTRDVIAIAAGELQRRGAQLQAEFADGLPPVSADRVQLQQVILNLLLNAAEATTEVDDRARTILVRTSLDDGDNVKLTVRDSGVGVDPDAVENLFETFYTTKVNGMGVGLSICRSIIESHDGRLWGEANDGPGATFSFWLPATPSA